MTGNTAAAYRVHDAGIVIGSSPATSRLRAYLPRVSASAANVLITGDTGTGKERIAEAIHSLSPRHDKPFVCVNCGAIPDTLLESELFGHERGAYTGADQTSPGKVQMAEDGTLFLDEIGEMSPYGQTRILRLLENRDFSPLGSRKVLRTSTRFIAATNQELEPLVRAHRFRGDLFFRLNVIRIHLSPLADRKEDIPALLQFFLKQHNGVARHDIQGFAPELMGCLLRYGWPGNVRELRNFIEAIFVDPPSGLISFENLPNSFAHIFQRDVTNGASERDRIFSALSEADWNKTKAAELLKISRMTLYRKMLKFNINQKHREPAA